MKQRHAEAEYGVTAVFPWQEENNGMFGCYAHVGQHSACSRGWYYTTRPATPAEYADLKRELESEPYKYELRVMKRWPNRASKPEPPPAG